MKKRAKAFDVTPGVAKDAKTGRVDQVCQVTMTAFDGTEIVGVLTVEEMHWAIRKMQESADVALTIKENPDGPWTALPRDFEN